MMKSPLVIACALVMATSSCTSPVNFQAPPLTPESVGPKDEIAMQAQALGIDYAQLERKALTGDSNALAAIIALKLDGAAGEELDGRKCSILLHAPSNDVIEVLNRYSPEFRTYMLGLMRLEFVRANHGSDRAEAEFERKFGMVSRQKSAEPAMGGNRR
jgi:hypothetical protein